MNSEVALWKSAQAMLNRVAGSNPGVAKFLTIGHWGTSNDLVLRNGQFKKVTTTPFNLITTLIKLVWQKISSSQNKKKVSILSQSN